MDWILEVLKQLGGAVAIAGGAISVGCTIWTARIARNEQAEHDQALARLESNLRGKIDLFLAIEQSKLDLLHERAKRLHDDKLACYSKAITLVAEFAAEADEVSMGLRTAQDFRDAYVRFNRERLPAYSHMALVAPQAVMDAFDRLVEYILGLMRGDNLYDFPSLRRLALNWINEARKDIGINSDPIEYRGHL